MVSLKKGVREAMKAIQCAHCHQFFVPNPRVKNQRYCGEKPCQRARKTLWQKLKLKIDPDYQANQRDCQKQWRNNNPDYWRNWRAAHPGYTERNRIRSRLRSMSFANMDASKPEGFIKSGYYFLIPEPLDPVVFAKMDASIQKVQLISTG